MWFIAYSLIGLFLRYFDKPSPRWRYLADASYWIYIVPVPVVMLLPLLLASVPLPGNGQARVGLGHRPPA